MFNWLKKINTKNAQSSLSKLLSSAWTETSPVSKPVVSTVKPKERKSEFKKRCVNTATSTKHGTIVIKQHTT